MNPSPTVPETPSQSPEPGRRRRSNSRHQQSLLALRRRRINLGIGVAVLLVAALLGGPLAYRVYTNWRSTSLTAESARWLERNDFGPAAVSAKAALKLTPGDPAALRALATAQTRAANVAALHSWGQLLQTGHATEQDRRAYVEQAIRAGEVGQAADELQKLLAEAPTQAANLWLAAQLSALRNDPEQTRTYATQAAARDPSNPQYNLFLATLQFDAPDAARRAAARSNLWAQADDRGPLGLQALVFLAPRKDLTPEQNGRLVTLLRLHPLRTTSQDLAALGLELAAAPGRRDELLEQALARYQKSEPKERIEFAGWLNQNGEFERTLVALPLGEVRKRKDFFLPHLDALAGLGRWTGLLKLVDSKPMPLEAAYAEAFRARCHAQLKNEKLATLNWRVALRLAGSNPEQLTWLARFAEKCGELDTARKATRALAACQANPRPAFLELERLTRLSGTTTDLRDLLVEMTRRWPQEPAFQNEHAYLNLLLGEDPEEPRQTVAALLKESPANGAYRTTFALALWRQKDFASALRAYEGQAGDWSQSPASQRVVYAAVLAANNRADEARQIARALPANQLRPEELELLKPLL